MCSNGNWDSNPFCRKPGQNRHENFAHAIRTRNYHFWLQQKCHHFDVYFLNLWFNGYALVILWHFNSRKLRIKLNMIYSCWWIERINRGMCVACFHTFSAPRRRLSTLSLAMCWCKVYLVPEVVVGLMLFHWKEFSSKWFVVKLNFWIAKYRWINR